MNPKLIKILLNLCPICPDIQYKILMLIIGINGTPSSILIKPKMINIRNMYIKKFSYPEQTLSYYMVSLGLFNYKKYWNNSESEDSEDSDNEDFKYCEYLSEFLYEISIAYNLYNLDTEKSIQGIQNCLNIQAKKRLIHMIESEHVVI